MNTGLQAINQIKQIKSNTKSNVNEEFSATVAEENYMHWDRKCYPQQDK
jgi:hypothetical protein